MVSLPYFQTLILIFVKWLWLHAHASGNYTDHLALLKFKQGITNHAHGVLNSWNDSVPFCNWYGIKCSTRHQRVASIILRSQNLVGSISPYIGNLSFLKVIDLQNNSLHGDIPHEVGRLFRLQQFLLTNNSIGGEIPSSIVNCSELKLIEFGTNKIAGIIPVEIGSLKKLQYLYLPKNNFRGEIPASIGNISGLEIFIAGGNNLEGYIPEGIGRLPNLTWLGLGENKLSGVIPASLFNITSLYIFSVALNQLQGTLPHNMCLNLPNLQKFTIGGNIFSGPIPKSLSNCSKLENFDIVQNNFVGQVPTDLGKLQSLKSIGLGANNLGRNSTNDLLLFFTSLTNCSNLKTIDIGNNSFGGTLPRIIANLSTQLNYLYLGKNQFFGTIPATLDNLSNLILLSMPLNLFTGSIPSSLGKLSKLQLLGLYGNRLSGQIPFTFGNLTQLVILDMSHNKLEGRIPSSIENCRQLYQLDISDNSLHGDIPPQILLIPSLSSFLNLSTNLFTGNLPVEVGKLTILSALDVSENNLSGGIPGAIGDCISLEGLYMQGNSLEETIPSSLTSLKGLRYLDLSRNNLTGQIPKDLMGIPFLSLKLSFNNLEGEVPTEGVFKNASALSLVGNEKLCGGISELHLPRCPTKPRKKGKSLAYKLAIIITCVVLFVILMLASLFLYWMRRSKKRTTTNSPMFDEVVRVSYGDLYHATDGFSPNNLVGSGSFGTVYKGFLGQLETPIAVKVLNLGQKGASKSFLAECKALRNVRHRNLMKLLTHCSSIDYKGNEFKALIFEFMQNGSLDWWLHANKKSENISINLNLLQRLNIAIDVASAMEHLHNFSESPIVHCDLKPSNVLLDGDMVAHLSDFGLARIFSTAISSSVSQTSTTGIKGTIGYTAPEYGTAGAPSKEGDAYSFGILLLEMFTGRRPTDEMFKDGFNLYDFVKAALPERLLYIVDPLLLPGDEVEEAIAAQVHDHNGIVQQEEINNEHHRVMTPNMQKCLLSALEIGLACSVKLPKDRMNMLDVTKRLNLIKTDFLGSYHNGGRPITRVQNN